LPHLEVEPCTCSSNLISETAQLAVYRPPHLSQSLRTSTLIFL